MKKKLLSMFLLTIMLVSVVSAGNGEVTAYLRDFKVTLDGKTVELKDANQQAITPIVVNGSTYLPVRAIGETLGLTVDWNGETQTVILSSTKKTEQASNAPVKKIENDVAKTELQKQAELYVSWNWSEKRILKELTGRKNNFTEEESKKTLKDLNVDFNNSALKRAEDILDFNLSKKGIYRELVKNTEGFSEEQAQYAIDNLVADYKQNALEAVEKSSDSMHYSKKEAFKYLTAKSNFNGMFTEEEAQYAIDNADIDYKNNALESAIRIQDSYKDITKEKLFELLSGDMYGFTKEEAQYAIDNLDN